MIFRFLDIFLEILRTKLYTTCKSRKLLLFMIANVVDIDIVPNGNKINILH